MAEAARAAGGGGGGALANSHKHSSPSTCTSTGNATGGGCKKEKNCGKRFGFQALHVARTSYNVQEILESCIKMSKMRVLYEDLSPLVTPRVHSDRPRTLTL